MFPEITSRIAKSLGEFDQIPAERKILLQKIAGYISSQLQQGKKAKLVYICIHNSRRSHFGQVAAAVAAHYFNLNLECYSGGTEVTAFNSNAIAALKNLGFQIESDDQRENPNYDVWFSTEKKIVCFSKTYDHPTNPVSDFAAIMTCGEAEENCPFIPNAGFKISTTYEDPKAADGSGKENSIYTERFLQILRETLFAFSLVKT